MSQFNQRYYPTLCIRRAEMKAIENLPVSEKEKMFPVVLLAPWLNSREFNNTFEVISKCVGKTPIIVDVDRYFQSDSESPSRQYFRKLLDKNSGPSEWVDLIRSHENYIPCLLMEGISPENIDLQIEEFRKIGRGYAIRIELQRTYDLNIVRNLLENRNNDDVLLIIDYGYSGSNLLVEQELSAVIDCAVAVSPEIPFVISGSNFPNAFSQYDNFASVETIASRQIYNRLLSKYGNYKFYYGDWASTKPRKYDGGGIPIPRIDFPTSNQWIIARSKDEDWDFKTAAEMITRLPEWSSRPMVWGTGIIEKAANGLPGGISTGPQAIAARVNIHLYLQSNFGQPITKEGPKGDWQDPI